LTSRRARLDAAWFSGTSKAPLIFFLCVLAVLIGGCGGRSQGNTAVSVPSHPRAASERAKRSASADEGDATIREDRAGEQQLASGACEALSPATAVALEPRLRKQESDGAPLESCSYSTADPEKLPRLHLILEVIPSVAEPSVPAAKAICQKLIKQIVNGSRYTTSEAPASLGEEAVVASTFERASLVGDETTYVADWREGGSCASLIFGTEGPARPPAISKFTELAMLVSGSG
jgi:hypothetical protein